MPTQYAPCVPHFPDPMSVRPVANPLPSARHIAYTSKDVIAIPPSRLRVTPALTDTAGIALWLVVLLTFAHARAVEVVVCNALIGLACAPLAVVIHESGHVAAAALVRFRVALVYIGCGPGVWSRRIGNTQWVLQAVSFTGVTIASPIHVRWLRSRYAVYAFGGPFANLVAAYLLWMAMAHEGGTFQQAGTHVDAPLMLFLVNVLFFVGNLLPFKRKTVETARAPGTDGYVILTAPWISRDRIERMARSHDLFIATGLISQGQAKDAVPLLEQCLARMPESAGAKYALGEALLFCDRSSESIPHLRAGLTLAAEGSFAAIVRSNLAWAIVHSGDASLLAEADGASSRAIELEPKSPKFQCVRAAVLIAQGRYDSARDALLVAEQRTTGPAERCFLHNVKALLAATDADQDGALRELELARANVPTSALCVWTEAKVRNALAEGSPRAN